MELLRFLDRVAQLVLLNVHSRFSSWGRRKKFLLQKSKIKMWQKLKNSKCNNSKPQMWQNSKKHFKKTIFGHSTTFSVTKIGCDNSKAQVVKNSKTQTDRKLFFFYKTLKRFFTTWHLNNKWDVRWTGFSDLAMFFRDIKSVSLINKI